MKRDMLLPEFEYLFVTMLSRSLTNSGSVEVDASGTPMPAKELPSSGAGINFELSGTLKEFGWVVTTVSVLRALKDDEHYSLDTVVMDLGHLSNGISRFSELVLLRMHSVAQREASFSIPVIAVACFSPSDAENVGSQFDEILPIELTQRDLTKSLVRSLRNRSDISVVSWQLF